MATFDNGTRRTGDSRAMSMHADTNATLPAPNGTPIVPPSATNAVTITPLPTQDVPTGNTQDNDADTAIADTANTIITAAGTSTRQRTGAQAAQSMTIHGETLKVAAGFAAIVNDATTETPFVPPTKDDRVLALIDALTQRRAVTVYWDEISNGVSVRHSGKLAISGKHGCAVLTTSDSKDHTVKSANILSYLSTTAEEEVKLARAEHDAKTRAAKARKDTLNNTLGALADIAARIKARAAAPAAGTPASGGE